jgi:WD40 repeat protein
LDPAEKFLASYALDTISVWDVSTHRELRTFARKRGFGANAIALSPVGGWLAVRGKDKSVDILNVETGETRQSFQGPEVVSGVAFSPDGHVLASGFLGRTTIKLWDFATGKELRSLEGHARAVDTVAFSPDGHVLASGGLGHTIELWDVVTGKQLRALETLGWGSVLQVAFSRDGRLLGAATSGPLMLWQIPSGRLLHSFALGPQETANSVAFSPDGRRVAGSLRNGFVSIWDVATGERLHLLSRRVLGSSFESYNKGAIAFMSDGLRLLAADPRGITVWNTETGRQVGSFTARGKISQAAFTSDWALMASASRNHAELGITLWDVATGNEIRSLPGQKAPVHDLSFSSDGRWLASASLDGSVQLWDPRTGEELATLAYLREEPEWLVATPDGLFDGSPQAWNRIIWRFAGNQTASLETFFGEFYYPGLLADILAGKKPRAPRNISELDRRQPKLELALASGPSSGNVASRRVKVKLKVTEVPADSDHSRGSGAQDVRLFRNGSLVSVWRGDVLQGKPSITLEADVPIVAGANRFTAYAFNRDNIKSADAELLVPGAASLSRKGTAYVLAVGINRYANADYDLSYAVPDAKAFAEALAEEQTKLGTFGKVEVVSLLDQDATKGNVLRAMSCLSGSATAPLGPAEPAVLAKLKHAEPEDAVFVYYAGHGTTAGPRFYLIPHDLGYSGSRTGIDEAGLKAVLEHSISDRDLEQAFEKIDAGRLLLVIDACNSGQALEAEEKRRGPMNSKGLAQLAYEKGMYVLTAAQGYQAALEAAQLGHGYLTYALVEEGLKTPSADSSPKDGNVMVREWLDYATLRVPLMQEQGMQDARKLGRNLAMVEGEEKIDDLAKRSLQRPRVFYRREPEAEPLVVARPPSGKPAP